MPGTVADARLAGKTARRGRAPTRRSRGRVLRGARMARTIPAMVAFDTLKASRRLRDAGFEEKQADALVNAFAEDIGANLATKNDLALLRKDMTSEFAAVRKDMASEFTAVRQEMASEFAAVRQEMASEFTAVRQEMASENAALRQEMTSEFAAVRQDIAALRNEMAIREERLEARMNARTDRQATRFTLIVAGFAGLILTAIGIATGVLATL